MNRAQRVVILIGLLVIAGLALFPSWHGVIATTDFIVNAGRHPLSFSKTARYMTVDWGPGRGEVWVQDLTVNAGRLLAECLVVGAITAGLAVALGRKKPQPSD